MTGALSFDIDRRTAFISASGPAPSSGAPVLVLVPGAGGDHTAWFQIARALAADGTAVLAPDLPGHGRTAGPMPPSVPALAAWLWRLLDAAGASGQVVLAGHSLGSLIALEAAGQAPQRVAGLALLGTALPMAVSPDLLSLAHRDPAAAGALMTKWSHGTGIRTGGSAVPGLWTTSLDYAVMGASGDALHAALKACADYPEAAGLEAAGRVAAPVLLLLGRDDRMTPPRAARRLAAAFADGRSQVLADCGHMLMVEQPAAVRAALRELLAEARSAKRAA